MAKTEVKGASFIHKVETLFLESHIAQQPRHDLPILEFTLIMNVENKYE